VSKADIWCVLAELSISRAFRCRIFGVHCAGEHFGGWGSANIRAFEGKPLLQYLLPHLWSLYYCLVSPQGSKFMSPLDMQKAVYSGPLETQQGIKFVAAYMHFFIHSLSKTFWFAFSAGCAWPYEDSVCVISSWSGACFHEVCNFSHILTGYQESKWFFTCSCIEVSMLHLNRATRLLQVLHVQPCVLFSFARDPHMRNGLNVQVWLTVNHEISAHCWRSGSIVCRSLASCTKSCALIWNSTITPWPNWIQLNWIQLMGKRSTVEKFSLDQGNNTAER
jgi:hypothetical protein